MRCSSCRIQFSASVMRTVHVQYSICSNCALWRGAGSRAPPLETRRLTCLEYASKSFKTNCTRATSPKQTTYCSGLLQNELVNFKAVCAGFAVAKRQQVTSGLTDAAAKRVAQTCTASCFRVLQKHKMNETRISKLLVIGYWMEQSSRAEVRMPRHSTIGEDERTVQYCAVLYSWKPREAE